MGMKRDEAKEKLLSRSEKDPETGCLVWQGAQSTFGHGHIVINGVQMLTHRLSYELHEEEIADGMQINHKCHNPACINPEHLYMGTQKENVNDAVEEGSYVSNFGVGEGHIHSKLCEQDVIEMREKYETGDYTHEELADEYGVGVNTAGEAIRGVTWSHVGGSDE
jgi:hypothetical protein